MSRVGKKNRIIPSGVTVEIKGQEAVIKGPKGELREKIHPRVTIVVKDGAVEFRVIDETSKKDRALWGTFSSLVNNMIVGVTAGFKKQLEINGVGYKAALKGAALSLDVGYTHPVVITPAVGIKFQVEKNIITVEGADKQLVGETAAQIRAVRKPEPYKGKGIRYLDEIVRRKVGKTAAKAAA